MEHCEDQQRAFYRRQARRLLAFAEGCADRRTAEVLLDAARYYLDKLETPPDATAVAA
jgi:hypothetical protein